MTQGERFYRPDDTLEAIAARLHPSPHQVIGEIS